MGYMSTVTLRNTDLAAIAADPDFGERLSAAIRFVDSSRYFEKEKNGDIAVPDAMSWSRLCEIQKGMGRDIATVPYDFWVSIPMHADIETISVIEDGKQITYGMARRYSYEDFTPLADAITTLGYAVHDKETGDKWPARADKITAAEFMGEWDQDLIMAGTTTLSILLDGLGDIAKDKSFPARLVQAIHDFRAMEQALFLQAESTEGGVELQNFYVPDDVYAGSFANPCTIVCQTPKGGRDLVVAGQNWGRALRPYKSLREYGPRGDRTRELLDRSAKTISELLLRVGFHVRAPGKQRADSPKKWSFAEVPPRPAR